MRLWILFGTVWALAVLCPPLSSLNAAETTRTLWYTDLHEAWKATQQQQRPLLVYITLQGCPYCAKMSRLTYHDRGVLQDIQAAFVPATIEASSGRALLRQLNVGVFPTTVIISPRGELLDQIRGYVPPSQLRQRLAVSRQRFRRQGAQIGVAQSGRR